MSWTGPGHQGLVGCLAVKNESLHRINLCMEVDVRKMEIIKKTLLMLTQSSQARLNMGLGMCLIRYQRGSTRLRWSRAFAVRFSRSKETGSMSH
jgi:hypothetical protein